MIKRNNGCIGRDWNLENSMGFTDCIGVKQCLIQINIGNIWRINQRFTSLLHNIDFTNTSIKVIPRARNGLSDKLVS